MGLTAGVLAVAVMGLCTEHAPSNPVKTKPAMILAVDFIMCAGNEVETDIVYVNPPQVHKFCAFAAESGVISKAKLDSINEQRISKLDNMPVLIKNSFRITSDHS